MIVDYLVQSKRYMIDGGKPQTRKLAYLTLRSLGFTHEEAEALLRANKLVAEIEARHPELTAPIVDDPMTPAEAAELLRACARAARRAFVIRAAEDHIKQHLRPAKHRCSRSVYSLKHSFEADKHVYIRESEYAEAMQHCGLRVVNGYVFAKEVRDE